jgi:class 3 adenylate cyclase/tetratricopeptide (TPR) repeat protein
LPAEARDPRAYTPRHLAERILTLRSAVEGEHKQVTVLFADVKGSLGLAEAVDLETWHRIMNRFFAILCEGIHRFEGTINQFTGDGVMALFGAPIAHEDHAQRACYAALQARGELRHYAGELKRSHGLTFSVRMGLNSGEVVVGRIGDDLRMDYTAQGLTVGLAARMEQLADPGTTYLSDATAALVSGFCELRDLGKFDVKGVREPVHVHELVGLGELRTRFDASRERGLSRFVGRRDEMETLESALESATRGRGSVVGVVGDAGVGKSRLCFEFSERCRSQGVTVRSAQAVAHGKLIPFLPLLEMLRSFFGVAEGDSDPEARQKIAGAVLLIDPGLTESLPLLFEFLGVPDPQQPISRLDPEARQERLVATVMKLVEAGSRREPVVFLIEDLHWADEASEAFLESLVEIAPRTRTLVLLNFRPEYQADWMKKSWYRALALAPLDDAAIRELLGDLLGDDPSTRELHEALCQQTRGNPFFAEEVVQSLLESGHLEGPKGRRLLVRSVERLRVPGSVQSVLSARIDRLGERDKRLLQTAAVIGEHFVEPLIERVMSLPEAEFCDSIRSLSSAGFIYQESLYPVAEYAFKHPLTREVAYRCQLSEPRARIHAAVGEAIEAFHADKLDESAALVAHHAEAAGDRMKAARWHRRAAIWVGARDVTAANRHWRAVMELCGDAPESAEQVELALTARIGLQLLAWRLGFSKEETARIFSSGVALAERSGDQSSIVMLSLGNAVYRGVIGDEEGQHRHGSEAAAIADGLGNLPLALAARVVMATSLHFQGRIDEAIGVADWAVSREPDDVAAAAAIFGMSPYTYILGLRGLLLALKGRFGEGARDLERALELADASADAEALGCVRGFSVQHARCAGDTVSALAHAHQMVEVAERTGIPLLRVDAYLALGSAHALGARWDEALAALERALGIVESRPILIGQKRRILAGLAEAYLGRGENERARHLAEELLALPRESRTLLVELQAQLVLARALLGAEGAKAAEAVQAAISEAVFLVETSGARAYEPEIHRVLGELAQIDGDEATRLRHLRQAQRLYHEMAATGHAERIDRELSLESEGG